MRFFFAHPDRPLITRLGMKSDNDVQSMTFSSALYQGSISVLSQCVLVAMHRRQNCTKPDHVINKDTIGTADDVQAYSSGSVHFRTRAAPEIESSARVGEVGLRRIPDMLTTRHGMLCVMRVQLSTKRVTLPLGTLTRKSACNNEYQILDK